MKKLLSRARTHLGVAVIGGTLLAVGGTATAAVVATSPAGNETEVTEPTKVAATEAAATSSTPAPEPVLDVEPTPESQPTATVEPMPTSQTPGPTGKPAPSTGQNMEGVGTTGPDGYYTPAAPRQNLGEPPYLPEPPPPPVGPVDPDTPVS